MGIRIDELTAGMSLEEFKSIGRRDWENGAVQDELYKSIRLLDSLKDAFCESHKLLRHYADLLNKHYSGVKRDIPESTQEWFERLQRSHHEHRTAR